MRLIVQLLHESVDLLLAEVGDVTRPVILVAQAPNNHRGMVVVLVDHIAQHASGLLLVSLSSQPAAAPRYFLPDQQAQLVTGFEHGARLLIVSESDEVRPHLLDQLHLLASELFGHRRAEQGVVLVAMRAFNQEPFAIELEGPVRDELEVAQPKALGDAHLAVHAGQRNFTSVQRRMRR